MSNLKIFSVFMKVLIILALYNVLVSGCLITNCPKGGKRSGNHFGVIESNTVKQCISCGPGGEGQCFGPKICCGVFGCHFGTQETLRCKHEGLFDTVEPCIAGFANCRGHNGRCALDGICCNQEICATDSSCQLGPKHMSNDYGMENLNNYINLEKALLSK